MSAGCRAGLGGGGSCARRLRGRRQRASAAGGIGGHSVDHAGAGREVLGEGLAAGGVGADELPAVGRRHPDGRAVEGDPAGVDGLGVESPQHRSVPVADQVGAGVFPVDDPQALAGRLQAVGVGPGALEDGLHLAGLSQGSLAERGGGGQQRQELPASIMTCLLVAPGGLLPGRLLWEIPRISWPRRGVKVCQAWTFRVT